MNNSFNVLILFQPEDGGTNVLLNRTKVWLLKNGFNIVDINSLNKTTGGKMDLVLLPTSEMYRLPSLWAMDIEIGSTIIWAMGSRAFQGAFINQMNASLAYKLVTLPIRLLVNKLLATLIEDKQVIFTDEVGMHADMQYLKRMPNFITELIIPIAIDVDRFPKIKVFEEQPKKIMWLGRIDQDFKALPLIKVIKDITDLHNRKILKGEIEFVIIGSGDGNHLVQQEIDNNFTLTFSWIKNVGLADLPSHMTAKIDVLFAMGTSALEGARLGLPTVIVQPFSHAIQEPKFAYRWIHQTKGHSLGEFPWVYCEPPQPKCDFESLWSMGTLSEHGKSSFDFSQKFGSEEVLSRLIRLANSKPLRLRARLLLHMLSALKIAKLKLKKLRIKQ